MNKITKKMLTVCLISAGLVISGFNVAFADDNSTAASNETTTSGKAWSSASINNAQKYISDFSQTLDKQMNVNVDNIFRISTLNKTQKAQFEKYTSSYTTALRVAKESMNFYKDDLNELISNNELPEGEKARLAEELIIKSKNDYKEAINAAQTYVRNCSFVMPTLTYQKFLKAFDDNFFLDDLDRSQYSIMK